VVDGAAVARVVQVALVRFKLGNPPRRPRRPRPPTRHERQERKVRDVRTQPRRLRGDSAMATASLDERTENWMCLLCRKTRSQRSKVLRRGSRFEANQRDLYNPGDRRPVDHGVLDRRLGTSDKSGKCETCGLSLVRFKLGNGDGLLGREDRELDVFAVQENAESALEPGRPPPRRPRRPRPPTRHERQERKVRDVRTQPRMWKTGRTSLM
jgi:hypothetical protein